MGRCKVTAIPPIRPKVQGFLPRDPEQICGKALRRQTSHLRIFVLVRILAHIVQFFTGLVQVLNCLLIFTQFPNVDTGGNGTNLWFWPSETPPDEKFAGIYENSNPPRPFPVWQLLVPGGVPQAVPQGFVGSLGVWHFWPSFSAKWGKNIDPPKVGPTGVWGGGLPSDLKKLPHGKLALTALMCKTLM